MVAVAVASRGRGRVGEGQRKKGRREARSEWKDEKRRKMTIYTPPPPFVPVHSPLERCELSVVGPHGRWNLGGKRRGCRPWPLCEVKKVKVMKGREEGEGERDRERSRMKERKKGEGERGTGWDGRG